MKSTFGDAINFTVFGESHGENIGITIDGLAPGIKIDLDFMNHQLDLRKPKGKISTARHESDLPKIISGYFNGYTTGTPLTILFDNNNTQSKDYASIKDNMRPGHADYSANVKYNGFQDYRGGGHFSGRLTTPIVAFGSIAIKILESKGIKIGSHIKQLNNIYDDEFNYEELETQLNKLNNEYFPVLSDDKKEAMNKFIEDTAAKGDSCGGVIETVVSNMIEGVGEPMFNSIESVLSHLLFSIPAVKGVEFGLGFDFANHLGSYTNDSFYYEDDKVKTKTNHNGGINGGISNGMPITIKTVIKPTPSIFKVQDTINIKDKKNIEYQINGRHDPAIIHRARVVADSVIAIGLLDLLCQRYGYKFMED